MSFFRFGAGALLGLSFLSACHEKVDDMITPPAPQPVVAVANWSARADSAQAALNQSFWAPTDQYYLQNSAGKPDFNYWWQAHGLDVLLDGYQRTKVLDYLTKMQQLQQGTKKKNGNTYLNTYYDDMAWNALANLRAFQITQDQSYKTTALLLWSDLKTGWNTRTRRPTRQWPSSPPASTSSTATRMT
jgi:hypothetical protein